ncbi:MAG: methylated-DNA--[protein]-cysteine S-methyltransferase, partial [Acidimicrobiia bacterium]
TDTGLRSVMWPVMKSGRVVVPEPTPDADANGVLVETRRQLRLYFDGETPTFDLPLDPQGTDLQQTVWLMLGQIPIGETWTYGQLAASIGRPSAVRAVANAVGRNPIGIIIPCHRVIGSNGSLTGFAGGIETKRWLLDHEQNRSRLPLG